MEGSVSMKSIQLTLPVKIVLWILSVIVVTYLYLQYRGERFIDLFRIVEKLTPSTTSDNIDLLFPEEKFPRDEITRRDGGLIRVIYPSPEQALRLRDEVGPLPGEISSCTDVPYLYSALVVSISSDGRVDGYSWEGEGPSWGNCNGRK